MRSISFPMIIIYFGNSEKVVTKEKEEYPCLAA
jgi:hypothetical protein